MLILSCNSPNHPNHNKPKQTNINIYKVYIDNNFDKIEFNAIYYSINYSNQFPLNRYYECCYDYDYENLDVIKDTNNLIFIKPKLQTKPNNPGKYLLGHVNDFGGNLIFLYPDNLYFWMDINKKTDKEYHLVGLILHEFCHHLGIKHDNTKNCNLMCSNYGNIKDYKFDDFVFNELKKLNIIIL